MTERILSHSRRNGYFVIDLQTGATISCFKGCSGRKYSSSFFNTSPVSSHLTANTAYYAVADSSRAFLHIFRTEKPDAPCVSHAVPEKLPALCFSPCGLICIAGGDTGNLYVWDISTGHLLRCWRGHYKSVTSVLMTPDGTFLLTAGGDSLVCCYNMENVLDSKDAQLNKDPESLHRWSTHKTPITSMAIGTLGNQQIIVLSGSIDRVVHAWRPYHDSPVATFLLPSEVRHLTMNPVSLEGYVCCSDSNIYTLDLAILIDQKRSFLQCALSCPIELSTTSTRTFIGHSGAVECCSPNIDGSLLVSCSAKEIRIWDIMSGQTFRHLPSLDDTLIGVSVFRDSSSLRNVYRDSKYFRSHHQESMISSSIPFPSSKALQRTWTNILQPPIIIRQSRETEFQHFLSNILSAPLEALRGGTQPDAAAELDSCNMLLTFSDSIETADLERSVVALKEDRARFNTAVCDLVGTICQFPVLSRVDLSTASPDPQANIGDDELLYRCGLPETPIPPSSIPIHHTKIPSQSRRLFQYVDRSFARSTFSNPPNRGNAPIDPQMQSNPFNSCNKCVSSQSSACSDSEGEDVEDIGTEEVKSETQSSDHRGETVNEGETSSDHNENNGSEEGTINLVEGTAMTERNGKRLGLTITSSSRISLPSATSVFHETPLLTYSTNNTPANTSTVINCWKTDNIGSDQYNNVFSTTLATKRYYPLMCSSKRRRLLNRIESNLDRFLPPPKSTDFQADQSALISIAENNRDIIRKQDFSSSVETNLSHPKRSPGSASTCEPSVNGCQREGLVIEKLTQSSKESHGFESHESPKSLRFISNFHSMQRPLSRKLQRVIRLTKTQLQRRRSCGTS